MRGPVLGLAGAVLARAALAAGRTATGASPIWTRTNHRGGEVSLLAGPALTVAAATTSAYGAPRGMRAAAGLVTLASGAVGVYDDLYADRVGAAEGARDKGFRGHLAALRAGRVTSGLVKVLGVGAAGVLAAGAVTRHPVDRVVAGGVVAGTANLLNLLDLRPGRALKVAAATGLLTARGPSAGLVAGPTGAALALLPDDLGERTMLGDGGANAVGAVLGLRLAAGGGPRRRAALLAGLAALTLASEKVSFTKVIESTPVLRELDRLGRRPV